MKPLIAVVDYEMGNLHSVSKALEKAGARVTITHSPSIIRGAQGLVLPGVGAFGEAVKRLQRLKLMAPILQFLTQEKPFFGICLGLQLLFERSEESPHERGLGVFGGSVIKFRAGKNRKLKIPHMGWNTLFPGPANETAILRGVKKDHSFYFVHSYYPAPKDKAVIATQTSYGRDFCSSIAVNHVFASQFHPEKSSENGLRLLRNFAHQVALCS